METDGWVIAGAGGQILEIRLAVGEKTPEEACIVYARNDGNQMIEAVFTGAQAPYVSLDRYIGLGTELSLQAKLAGGGTLRENVEVAYRGPAQEGLLVRIDREGQDLRIGQAVDLSCRVQTEEYATCVPVSSLYQDSLGTYVYVAQEQEGILGSQWHVHRVEVTVLDRTDRLAAVSSPEINAESRVVIYATGDLEDGGVVRVVG